MWRVRARGLGAALACLGIAAGALSAGTPLVAASAPPALSPEAEEAQARAAAEAEAAQEVAGVQLPGGSLRTALEPQNDEGALARPPVGTLPGFVFDDAGWAAVPSSESTVAAYLQEHAPPAATVSGASYPPTSLPNPARVRLTYPARPSGPISETEVRVTLLALPNGTTDVRIDGIALWVPVARPLPAGARLLVVTTASRGRHDGNHRTRRITAQSKIEMARSIIDALRVRRPSMKPMLCPPPIGGLSLAFYARPHAAERPLAAVYFSFGGCAGTSSTIRGVEAPDRESSGAVPELANLLAIKIRPG